MLHSKFRQALLAGAAATAALLSPYAAEAADLTVYVAANFTGTAKVLLDRFQAVNADFAGSSYQIAGGATGNLVTAIVNGGSYSSGTVTYPQADLFFAANTQALTTLATVSATRLTYAGFDTSTHYGWVYAQGFLELLSSNPSLNISSSGTAGLPGTWPISPALVIAKPSSAPYGHAALQVLKANYSSLSTYTDGSAFPTTGTQGVVTASDIGLTFQDIVSSTFTWGFVALSQIATYDPVNYVLNYTYTNHYAYQSGTDYDPILQGAVKVQGTGDTGFRDAFVTWLASRDAQAILLKGGYAVPYPIYP